MFILILLYLFFALLLFVFVLKIGFKSWSINALMCFVLIIFYCLIPVIFLLQYSLGEVHTVYQYPSQSFSLWLTNFFTIAIGLSFYMTFYYMTVKGHRLTREVQLENRYIVFFDKKYNLALFLGWLILIVSILAHFSYIKGFGSYEEAILQADVVRSGFFKEENQDTFFTFYKRFIPLSIICVLAFPKTRPSNRIIKWLYITIAVANVLMFYFFLDNSRQALYEFFFIFILGSALKADKLKLKLFLTCFVLVLISAKALDAFFSSRNVQDLVAYSNLFDSFFNEFGFPFFSIQVASLPEAPIDYFYDFYQGLYGTFLPSSWGPSAPTNVFYNSISLGMVANTVPPGIIGEGYYALGIGGVMIIMSFTGWAFAKMDLFFQSIKLSNTLFYAYIMLMCFSWIRTGTPRLFWYHTIVVSVFLFLYFGYEKKNLNTIR